MGGGYPQGIVWSPTKKSKEPTGRSPNLPTHAEAHPVVFLNPSANAKSEVDTVIPTCSWFLFEKNCDGYYLRNGCLSFCQNFVPFS